ncbi:hypothetical protein QTG54_016187 [Skeletonema marinoi]|uniref:Uncharacterized protein n=1 Tax=Skeletonema marinoi TaxID=267567 RepID=A0AAD9D4U4_9STRA|nr:hypothetical protein QTG54_016187 [Skeletonema marinoi]
MLKMTDLNQEELLENWPRQGVDSDDRLFCAAEKVVRRDTLLEHWPKRESMTYTSFDSGADDDASAANIRNRRHFRVVDFSEASHLHVYERESMYLLRSLTYTKDDRDEFGKDTLLEGLRIKNLVDTAPPISTAESIKYLLRHDSISRAELIGIEHFILGKPSRVQKIRKHHAAAVLWKQQELQHQKLEDPALNLGKFAQSSSLKSMQRARIRAAVAA